MKLIRWGEPGQERPGIVGADGRLRDLRGHVADIDGAAFAPAMLQKIAQLDPMALPEIDPETRLGPCIASVGHFLAIGLNYRDHAREAEMDIPAYPIVFSKAPSCICGPNDDILIPADAYKTDWEVELAVVIGRECYRVTEDRALESVVGFCICNDISERAFQFERGGQWIKGKSFPSFGPLGPWLVTKDEFDHGHAFTMWLEVNGDRVQNGTSSQMIFGIPQLVAYLSHLMVLKPGDVISSGTPAGIGMCRNPAQYLSEGDTVRCGIDGLGLQTQTCRRSE